MTMESLTVMIMLQFISMVDMDARVHFLQHMHKSSTHVSIMLSRQVDKLKSNQLKISVKFIFNKTENLEKYFAIVKSF